MEKFIDIRDAVIDKIKLQRDRRGEEIEVVIFGTPATIKNKLYEEKLKEAKISFINPSDIQAEELRKIIYQIKATENVIVRCS